MIDRIIWHLITPWCHLENTARKVGHWIAEKALDRHLTKFANVTAEPEEDEL